MNTTTEDVQQEKRNWHWRNSMRPVRFFALDARAAVPWAILLFRLASPFFWVVTLVITAIFLVLERRGLTFPAAMRTLRSWVNGQRRPGYISLRRRKMIDFG